MSSGSPAKATTIWWSTTSTPPKRFTAAAPNASPPPDSASCCTRWSGAAPDPAAPNGSPRLTSTPAKAASTTTTTRRNTYCPKKTKGRSHTGSAGHVNEDGLGRDGGDDVIHRAGSSRIHAGEGLTLAHSIDDTLVERCGADLVHDDVESL